MRKLIVFMMTTLDGYFEGPDGGIDWHNVDDEFNDFAIEQIGAVDIMVFGRKTYELMAGYWPTPEAKANDPAVAELMNTFPKIVVSGTLQKADWHNTRLVKENVEYEIQKLKQENGKDLIIFGSSALTASLANLGLVDEFRVMVNPVLLGGGRALFHGIRSGVKLHLVNTRTFRSGNVLLYYRPA
jgi:dihydrofolate reductase